MPESFITGLMMREKRLTRFLDAVSHIVSVASSTSGIIFVFGMALLITVDVIGRSIGHSTLIADEMSGYMLVGLAFLGLAYTQRKKRHIQITLITRRFSQRVQEMIELGVLIVGFVFASWLVWTTWGLVEMMYTDNRRSLSLVETPMWIPALFVPVGLGMFALELLIEIRKTVIELFGNKGSK